MFFFCRLKVISQTSVSESSSSHLPFSWIRALPLDSPDCSHPSLWNQNGEWVYQSPCQAWHSLCCWLYNSLHTHFLFLLSGHDIYLLVRWKLLSAILPLPPPEILTEGFWTHFFSPTSHQTSKTVIWANKLHFERLAHIGVVGNLWEAGFIFCLCLGEKDDASVQELNPNWDVCNLIQSTVWF